MKKGIIVLLTATLCFAFTTDVQKRMVREKGFDIECYISLKKLNSFNEDKVYFWFKSGEIHQSLSNIGGYVLHSSFLKYYRGNQLAEKGTFDFGLKTGVWESWYENGKLKLQEQWTDGYKDGEVSTYDADGHLVLKGKYRNNLKVGRWINYKTKDTTYYKKDFKLKEKPESLLHHILKRKDSVEKVQIKINRARKKKSDSIKRVKNKMSKEVKKRNDSINRANKKQIRSTTQGKTKNTSKSFFKKLFKKKEKEIKEKKAKKTN